MMSYMDSITDTKKKCNWNARECRILTAGDKCLWSISDQIRKYGDEMPYKSEFRSDRKNLV